MEAIIDKSTLLRPALEASPTAILVADPSGRIALVNRQLECVFGYGRDELVGQQVEVLVPELPDALREIHEEHARSGAGPPAARMLGDGRDLFGHRKDGERIPVEIQLQPIETTEGVFVLASIVDITSRRRHEDAQRASLEAELAFERLVGELSFQFINVGDDELSDAIRTTLARLCEEFGLDRASFFRLGPEAVVRDSVSWTAAGVPALDVDAGAPFPWGNSRLISGDVVAISIPDDLPDEADRTSYRATGAKSAVGVPVLVEGRTAAILAFETVRHERRWPPEVVHRLKVIGDVFGQLLARLRRVEAASAASAELRRLKDQLQVENVYLRQEERERLGLTRIVGQSPAIQRVLAQIQQVAPTDASVLLLGETGTGKELFAAYIHELGPRHTRAMVRVNCAAIPATLIESELFGRERGAFTGALARQVGRFELANHSTIFLDEIGDLPAEVQVKLLRVLEERTIERLGSPRPIEVDVRIIAATHRNLEQRIAEGLFREDLYYRLNVFPIHVPPLRERVEDIPLLLWRFVEEFSRAFGKRIDSIDKESLVAMQQYSWPGNIRELRNVVERTMVVATGRRLTITPPQASTAASKRSPKLVDVEKEHIRAVLESTGWRIRGEGGAADRLGLKPTTLETRLAKLGLRRPGRP